jgi:hypothetical protein
MFRRLRVVVPPIIVVVGLTAFFRVIFTHEAARRRLLPIMRPLYVHVFNPRALRDAARGETRWGVIHHVGRRSGRLYDNPIDAQPTAEGIVIPLVYGPEADWCRNVLAAGGCTLTLDGKDIHLTEPRVIAWAAAAPRVSPEKARFWRGIGIEHLLSLRAVPPVELASASVSAAQA